MPGLVSGPDEGDRTGALLAVALAAVAVAGACVAPVAAAGLGSPAGAEGGGAETGTGAGATAERGTAPGADAAGPPLDPAAGERVDRSAAAPVRAADGSAPTVESRTNVTLVTGQTVTVIETEAGTRYRVDAEGPAYRLTVDGDTYVLPADVDLEAFDRALFNVDLLVRQNLTDAETDAIPVIARMASTFSGTTSASWWIAWKQ